MLTNSDLWERLRNLRLDTPHAVFPFSKRLARDNGWSHEFALRAIEEYKRFAYLAMVAGREVTPSDEVDQVWHLHLTYTRHYWGPFVHMLGAPLHHGPTSGGASENARYEENYDATRRLYRSEFSKDPPTDIWPPAAKRFGEAPYFQRINMKNYWRFPKPALGTLAGSGLLAALTVIATGATAAKRRDQPADTDWVVTLLGNHWPILIVIVVVIVALLRGYYLAGKARKKKMRKSDQVGSGAAGGCGNGDSGCGSGDGGCGGGCGG